MPKEITITQPLTHRGNILYNANELIKDDLSGDVTLVDGITACDSLESVIWPNLTGLPLRHWRSPF